MSKNTPAQESLQLATPDSGTTHVEKYEFEPIKGYPMLNWRGKRPFTSTQYYPAQLKEVHGEEVDGWRNRIYWGDNLQVMSYLLKQFRGKVDLVYIDPPFDSKADYKKKIALRGHKVINDGTAFEEKQYADIWSNDEYLQFMYERLILIRELMAESASIILHADYHKAHLLRCILDEVFGADNFRNEIIIKRPITKNLQAQFKTINALSAGHDNLFLYSKSKSTRYKQAYDPYESENSDGYWHRFWSGEDRPTMRYPLLGVTIEHGQWKWSEERALRAHENYQTFLAKFAEHLTREGTELALVDYWRETGEELEFLRKSSTGTIENWYPPATQKLANTLWLNCKAYENRKDYPTQKHEELLRLIIDRFSEPGHLVFDCFMGSGATQSVATKLGRRFIGADINLGAIQTTTKRLIKVAEELGQKPLDPDTKHYAGFEVYNVNHYDIFRNPVQAKELLLEALEVQKLEFSAVFDGEKDGRMVKIMPVNRIATRVDLNELIAGFDYKAWERKQNERPNRPVEKITLICMGHEPDLAAQLELAAKPFKIDVEVVDILRDKANLEFKRDSEAKVVVKNGELTIERFYPMNLLQKLSLQKESVEDWKELVESVLIDWNYDGAVLQPAVVDIPGKNEMVKGIYKVPEDAGTIRVKITDLLSESWEGSVAHGD